jgi:hypothetical protein
MLATLINARAATEVAINKLKQKLHQHDDALYHHTEQIYGLNHTQRKEKEKLSRLTADVTGLTQRVEQQEEQIARLTLMLEEAVARVAAPIVAAPIVAAPIVAAPIVAAPIVAEEPLPPPIIRRRRCPPAIESELSSVRIKRAKFPYKDFTGRLTNKVGKETKTQYFTVNAHNSFTMLDDSQSTYSTLCAIHNHHCTQILGAPKKGGPYLHRFEIQIDGEWKKMHSLSSKWQNK